MKLVVDASVAVKWVLGANQDEPNLSEAEAVAEAIQMRGSELYAPPHWLAEILGVVARAEPLLVEPTVVLL